MRKLTLMLAAMALIVSLFATAAYAAEIWGDSDSERLLESDGNDKIFGREGNDKIFASIYDHDEDMVEGNRGDDKIRVDDGDNEDTVIGGEGFDECWGDGGDVLDCERVNGAPNPF